jgi:GntR family transcriptional regulator
MSFREQLASRAIDRAIPVPYYYQIAGFLREVIGDSGADPKRGEVALPSESELCAIYGVTRGTVRHALEVIEHEGLIYREKGRGTYLRRRRVGIDPTKLCSYAEDMRARGWEPGTHVLSVDCVAPRPQIQHQLHVADGRRVWELYRLRLADGEPLSIQWSYIPCDLAPDLDRRDLSGSLYYVLKNDYDHTLQAADQIIRVRAATLAESRLLGTEEGNAVFVIDRTTLDQRGDPVEFLHSVWRGDRYDFEIHLSTNS